MTYGGEVNINRLSDRDYAMLAANVIVSGRKDGVRGVNKAHNIEPGFKADYMYGYTQGLKEAKEATEQGHRDGVKGVDNSHLVDVILIPAYKIGHNKGFHVRQNRMIGLNDISDLQEKCRL